MFHLIRSHKVQPSLSVTITQDQASSISDDGIRSIIAGKGNSALLDRPTPLAAIRQASSARQFVPTLHLGIVPCIRLLLTLLRTGHCTCSPKGWQLRQRFMLNNGQSAELLRTNSSFDTSCDDVSYKSIHTKARKKFPLLSYIPTSWPHTIRLLCFTGACSALGPLPGPVILQCPSNYPADMRQRMLRSEAAVVRYSVNNMTKNVVPDPRLFVGLVYPGRRVQPLWRSVSSCEVLPCVLSAFCNLCFSSPTPTLSQSLNDPYPHANGLINSSPVNTAAARGARPISWRLDF